MSKKLTTEEFIVKAREVHGDRYDYKKAIYHRNNKKIEIICKSHGSFWQTPGHHITSKNGCPKCAGHNRTTEDFVKLATEIHNKKYDYSKAVYTDIFNKVEIICPIHGSFWQSPNNHINGKQGCMKCTTGYLYSVEEFLSFAKKIHGVTDNVRPAFVELMNSVNVF